MSEAKDDMLENIRSVADEYRQRGDKFNTEFWDSVVSRIVAHDETYAAAIARENRERGRAEEWKATAEKAGERIHGMSRLHAERVATLRRDLAAANERADTLRREQDKANERWEYWKKEFKRRDKKYVEAIQRAEAAESRLAEIEAAEIPVGDLVQLWGAAWIAYGHVGDKPEATRLYRYVCQLRAFCLKLAAENAGLRKDADIGKLVQQKMVSGNAVPVPRCVITAEEIAMIQKNLETEISSPAKQ